MVVILSRSEAEAKNPLPSWGYGSFGLPLSEAKGRPPAPALIFPWKDEWADFLMMTIQVVADGAATSQSEH